MAMILCLSVTPSTWKAAILPVEAGILDEDILLTHHEKQSSHVKSEIRKDDDEYRKPTGRPKTGSRES
jgi:hypothetical protein